MEELHKYIFSAVPNLHKFVVPHLKTLHSGHFAEGLVLCRNL